MDSGDESLVVAVIVGPDCFDLFVLSILCMIGECLLFGARF